MSQPNDPKRVAVLQRFVYVLDNIVAGPSYFYTRAEASLTFRHYKSVLQTPAYFVNSDTVDSAAEEVGTHLFREKMRVSVKCYIKGDDREPIALQLERARRDVVAAIEADHRLQGNGSLGTLCEALFVDSVEFDNGLLALEGYGYFDQGFSVWVEGDWGEI